MQSKRLIALCTCLLMLTTAAPAEPIEEPAEPEPCEELELELCEEPEPADSELRALPRLRSTVTAFSALETTERSTAVLPAPGTLPAELPTYLEVTYSDGTAGYEPVTWTCETAEDCLLYTATPAEAEVDPSAELPAFTLRLVPENGLLARETEDGCELIAADTAAAELILPETIGGMPLTALADGALSGHTELTALTLPKGLTRIGREALSGCTALSSLTIPDSLTELEAAALLDCPLLTALTLDVTGEATLSEDCRTLNGSLELPLPITAATVSGTLTAYDTLSDITLTGNGRVLPAASEETAAPTATPAPEDSPTQTPKPQLRDLHDATAVTDLPNDRVAYSGSAITPGVTVTYPGIGTLTEGTDYVVEGYRSNVQPGTGIITLRGMGLYTGTKDCYFTIVATGSGVTYTGTATIADTSGTPEGDTDPDGGDTAEDAEAAPTVVTLDGTVLGSLLYDEADTALTIEWETVDRESSQRALVIRHTPSEAETAASAPHLYATQAQLQQLHELGYTHLIWSVGEAELELPTQGLPTELPFEITRTSETSMSAFTGGAGEVTADTLWLPPEAWSAALTELEKPSGPTQLTSRWQLRLVATATYEQEVLETDALCLSEGVRLRFPQRLGAVSAEDEHGLAITPDTWFEGPDTVLLPDAPGTYGLVLTLPTA